MFKKPTYLRWLLGLILMLFIWSNSHNLYAQSMVDRAKQAEIEAMHGPTVEVPYSEGTRAVGDNCTTPIVVNIPGDLPYADLGNTTCGRGNTYSNSDLGLYDGGEDIIYQLNVTAATEVIITLDPKTTTYTGLGLFTSCPTAALGLGNYWVATGSAASTRTISRTLTPGTYYLMADTYPLPNCIPVLDLTITQVLPPAVVTAFPFIETFETTSATRADWRQFQEVGAFSWSFAAGAGGGAITTAFEGSLNAKFVSASGDGNRTKLISPPMDLSTLTSPRISFYLGQEDWLGDQNTTKVYYRVSATDPWVQLADYTNNISTWTMFDLELPNPSATYQVAFEGINYFGRANVIDLVTVYNVSSLPGLEFLTPNLSMGYRPIGAWMEPARYELINNPGEGDLSIVAADIDNSYNGFVDVVAPALPYTIASGATTTAFGLTASEAAVAPGAFNGTFAVIYGGNRAALTATYDGTAYDPPMADVVETAIDFGTVAATPAPVEVLQDVDHSRELFGHYKNYILPNDVGNGPLENDYVYKITFATDQLFSITTPVASPNIAIYNEDFDGEPGPMAHNAIFQHYGSFVDFPIFAGTYYFVVSDVVDWVTFNYSVADMPVPDAVTYVSPADGAVNINNNMTLNWIFGDYTDQYELVLGTTYPPSTIVVPFTSDLATSYVLTGLQPNMQYFWQVNVKNTQGTTYGDIWGFTTTIDVPTGLTVNVVDPAPTVPTLSAVINWTGPSDRAFIGYNVYRNGVKLNATPLTESTYTDINLARNTTYSYQVSNVFDEGESAKTAAVSVTTKGVGTFNGFVFNTLGGAGIEGATVRVSGTAGDYSVQTAANGAYTTLAYAGTYSINVSAAGFTSQTRPGQSVLHAGVTSNDFYMMEVPYPVGDVVAFELSGDAVQISWDGSGPDPIAEWLYYDNGVPTQYWWAGAGTPFSWAISFDPADLADFDGTSLTKIAIYNTLAADVNTLKIYQGDLVGGSATLLHTQALTGMLLEDWNEVELLSSVPVDITKQLWITMSSPSPTGGVAASSPVASTKGDWFNYSGVWQHMGSSLGYNVSWNLRAFVTNAVNSSMREIVSTQDDFKYITDVPVELASMPARANIVPFHSRVINSDSRAIVSYDVWREKVYQPGTLELIGNTVQQNFVDFDWGIQDWGVYRWAITVNYDLGQVSPPTFSNKLDKDMYTTVDVAVTLNSGDSPAGTQVTFTNTSEPALELVYDETLGGSGQFTWDMFRRGVYDIEVFKAGYTSVSLSGVEIFDEASFEWLLDEILAPPTGLYVTPTGLARWMGGSSLPFTPFMETFDAGEIPAGWVVERGPLANATGAMWQIAFPTTARPFTNTPYMKCDIDAGPSSGDTHSLLYTPVIDASNAATLYLEFDQYYNYISNESADVEVFDGTDWVVVLHQVADIGSWTVPNHQVIDVSAYANAAFQVRFNYLCPGWNWYWSIDNVALNEVVTRGADRSFVNYKVFHDGVLVAEVEDSQYQYGTNGEALVDGETYLAEVATVYSTGQSARAAYTWTYIACDNYAVPGSFTAAQVEGTLDVAINWTIPTIPVGEDQIDFARITRDGEVIAEVPTAGYLDENLALGTYEYCITFVYESGAETCPATLCETVEVTGGAFVNGNVKEAAYLGGNNITGASVVLTNDDDNSIVFSFVTDASGNYSGEVLAGTYNYVVTAEGYITATLEGVSVPTTATVTRNFELMEFPAPVELVVATELSDAAVQVTWRTPGTILFEPTTENFNNGMPADWTIVSGGTTADTWELVTSYSGSTLDGTPFMLVDSDGAGIGPILDEMLYSPVINTLGAEELYLEFDQYYRHLGTGSYGNVDVFDGTDWVNVLSQTATAGAWSAPNMQSIDVTAYANPQFQVRFHYFDNGAWAWYWALDNVTLTDQTSTRALALAPQSTLAGYNVYRTTCAEGGDLQFLGYTLDTTFNDNTWVSAEAGVYRWAVEAVYAQNESELRFSNCLDKDMITQVSVAVSTNSLDSPEGTDVMFTNTSEPDLALVYSTELDASGVYTWEEFRKGTYDIYVEKNGFAPISITGYVIDGPEAFVWVLEELLLPVSDLHVSPTGFATWRPGGVIPFEPFAFDFEADAQGWDIQGNVNGWQWGNNTSLSSSFMNFNGNDTHFLAVNADAAGSGGAPIVAMATSPVMNLENADEVFVSFDYKLRSDALSVHYSIDGGAPVLLEDLAEYYSAGWTNHVIALPEEALVSNVQLIFLFEESGTWGYGGAFDNVSVSDVAPENARSLVNYKVWLDGVFATDTENTYWQYDPSNLVPGQEYFSEVAAVYTNGISAKMSYTWTYFPCDSFPGPADVTAEVENVNDVVISWGGNTPPPPGGEFFEDFEAGTLPTGWVVYDVDGDGFKWDNSALEFDVFDAHSGAYCMTSASYRNDVGALTPNNWLVTPAIAVTAGSQLSFWVDAQDPAWSAEQYYVKISTTGNAVADFTTTLHSAVSPADWAEVVLDLSAYAGETVYIAFQHANVTDQFFIKIDDVKVTNTASRAAHTSPLAAGLSRAIPFKTQGLSQSEIDARINHTGAYAIVNVSENTFVANNVVNVAGDSKPLSSNRALLYDNGPLVNSPGTGVGGADESILQNVTLGMTTLGAGIQFASGNHMADDFVVDANWTIDQFTFYGYQTGSTTTSTMTGGYLQIYNGNPSTGGTVVWGDMTTNRMSSTTFSNIYRLSEGTPGTNRPIMEIVCETPGLTLTPGTYWVEYTLDGSLTSGPWAPPITITGETTTGNALQYLPASGWQPFQDGGTLTPQGLPFLIAGTANNGGGGSTTFDPGEYLGANVYRDGVLIAEMVQGETYTDEAVDPGYYDYCVTFVYTDGAESCLSSCVLDVLVTEDCEAPQNLTATLVEENNEVTLVWNENIAQEFRYDDGVATGQLGFTGGTTSSVLGAKHNTSAEITEVSWYLTSEGGPHSTVQIYIFGLDGSGLPNGSNVLYTASVSNTDDTWNTYTLPAPVAATGGFFLGVGYNGFAALGTDDGAGAPWVFQNNTHYFVSDYSAGGWATWESVGFAVNGMIRAIGVAGATASYAVNNEAPVVVNDKSQMSMVYTRLAQPATTGEPQWTQDARSADRAFMGYNIYKDGQLLEALWPETTYVYLEPNAGNTCYTVTAEYEFCGETEPSNEACVDIITDVENTDLSKISMYPNPSNSVVNIELTNDVSQVVVYNYVGQVVYEQNVIKTKRIELNVRNYESGAYLVKFVTNAGDSFTKKMVVTK